MRIVKADDSGEEWDVPYWISFEALSKGIVLRIFEDNGFNDWVIGHTLLGSIR
jgi:hypothetical protein